MCDLSEFVKDNEDADLGAILLSRNRIIERYSPVDMTLGVETILVRRKLKTKVPSWYGNPRLIYPMKLSGEQCSSEYAAGYKAAICREVFASDSGMSGSHDGFRVADLTGGLGVDSWAFAQVAERVLYNEMNPILADAAVHNFRELGASNVEVCNRMLVPHGELADAVESGNATDVAGILGGFRPDFIFLDPARRSDSGRKVFLMEDCRPDVLALKDELMEQARYVLLKLSPMADIGMVLKRLGKGCRQLHILSYSGECKELTVLIDREWQGDCGIVAASPSGRFMFSRQEQDEAKAVFLPSMDALPSYSLLFEPGKSLMKSAAFNLLCVRFPLVKLGRSTHYYLVADDRDETVDELLKYGKVFHIEEVMPLNNRNLKETGKRYPRSEVSARNIQMDTALMQKKLGVIPGDDFHIFGLRCDTGGISENCIFVTSLLRSGR